MIPGMNLLRAIVRVGLFALPALVLAGAQSPDFSTSLPRVNGPVEDSRRIPLAGNVLPLALGKFDLGAVDENEPTGRMLLLLKRSPEQESRLRTFIDAAHTPGNPLFHKWLTPQEFGDLYGPADSDIAAVNAWLQSHGLTVEKVHRGRLAIEFSGTAGQLRSAFQTEIHRYDLQDTIHLATATEPAIPAALAPVVAGLAPLHDFHPKSLLRLLGSASFNPVTHRVTPRWTAQSNGVPAYAMAPGDFVTQYDLQPAYSNGLRGLGQSIAIVSASNVDLALVQSYNSLFGLSPSLPAVVVDGVDPGQNDSATEAYLDIEMANAVAPGAQVILYTSAGTALTDGVALAALRAVEDDQAGIVSTSYGECEAYLGQSGNAFWNALWQQAAAQGQTAFVAAGDGGSAGCDDFDVQNEAYAGLQVNGIASTPYDVAVGGTDLYYSQYAGGSTSANTQLSTYWAQSTTSPAISLRQRVPEQAWNDYFGFNIASGGNPSSLPSQTILATGGGASRIAYYPAGKAGQGYPKPAWQFANGVPNDQVRDLPDVSLFAANGYNSSFYPICAQPGDCAGSSLSSGSVTVTGVGGTSAAAPAMAGIQALVNQSTGSWAGQANYVYYYLSIYRPSAFHDVTLGGNQVLCYPGSANCGAGTSGTISGGFQVESGYAAGPGYDLATGLGTVDVANLIKYWNATTFRATTTTLSISPSTFVHGRNATVQGAVAPSSGPGTPTGSVSLNAISGINDYNAIGNASLVGGAVYGLVDNLPGGTYQVTASYGGDASYSRSQSPPVTITVTPEIPRMSATGWAWNPYDMVMYPLTAGITVPYGAQIFLDAQPASANATISSQPAPATGVVTFTDRVGSAVVSSNQPLNAAGVAEWSTGVFAPGSHVVAETYFGDPSYSSATVAAAAQFTIVPGSTSLSIAPLVRTVAAGASVAVDVELSTGYLPLYGKNPGGSVTVKLGSQSQTVPWQAFGTAGNAGLEAVVTFAKVPSGILPLTASYAGDANWLGSAANGGTVLALSSKLTTTVALTSSSNSPTPGETVTLTATVSAPAGKPIPSGSIVFTSHNQGLYEIANLKAGTAVLNLPAASLDNGVNLVTAVYQGDVNYGLATSNTVNVAVSKADYSLNTLNPEIQAQIGGSGSATLTLTAVNGFNGAASLTWVPSKYIAVQAATTTPTIAGTTTDTVTFTPVYYTPAGIYPIVFTVSAAGHVHTVQIRVAVLASAPPIAYPPPGTYTSRITVMLTGPTVRSTSYYYTLDGSTPTVNSTEYTAWIPIAASETLKVISVLPGYMPGAVANYSYVVAPPAPKPYCSRGGGLYSSIQYITLLDNAPGATIYYTTDGSTPTTSSQKFTTYLTIAQTETVKAIATAPGYSVSPVASTTYTIQIPTATPVFSPRQGDYPSPIVVSLSDATPGATIYYTTNSQTPTTASPKYTGPFTLSSSASVFAIATAPGYVQSLVAKANYYLYQFTAPPVFSPGGGSYATAQSVTITDATPGAVIYFTTDGTTPNTNSTVYTQAIPVKKTQTLKAFAVAPGDPASAFKSATYTIASASTKSNRAPPGER